MKHIVGVADMRISIQASDVIVTHALGSCLGIAVYDPASQVGGLLHVMMPLSNVNPSKAKSNPFMFIDTGVPAFFKEAYAAGASKARMVVKVAGGANVQGLGNDTFAIGKRNHTILKKMLWKNNILVEAEDVGGQYARTMYLDIGDGHVWLSTGGCRKDL